MLLTAESGHLRTYAPPSRYQGNRCSLVRVLPGGRADVPVDVTGSAPAIDKRGSRHHVPEKKCRASYALSRCHSSSLLPIGRRRHTPKGRAIAGRLRLGRCFRAQTPMRQFTAHRTFPVGTRATASQGRDSRTAISMSCFRRATYDTQLYLAVQAGA
jgi:hypothetical protein